jgi:hypothetical protein
MLRSHRAARISYCHRVRSLRRQARAGCARLPSKPVDEARLADVTASGAPAVIEACGQHGAAPRSSAPSSEAERRRGGKPLQWIRVQSGKTVRLIPIDDVDYSRSTRSTQSLPGATEGIPQSGGSDAAQGLLEQVDSE